MTPEKQRLRDDVFGAAASDLRREAVLRAGGKILRRRRARRFAVRSLAVMAVVILAVLALRPQPPVGQQARALPPQSQTAQEPVTYLTDDELLALFPGTPVGLIKTPDGKKRLIFPRPGDEDKYIIHL